MSTDLTFLTNEAGHSLLDRFNVLLKEDTHLFDCLVGYFFLSGFYKIYPSLEKTEKIRILIGLKTDPRTFELIQQGSQELDFKSHAETKEEMPGRILDELEGADDFHVKANASESIEMGVKKFVEWIRTGKLEIKAYPTDKIHAKLYIMTFHEGDRDKGRVVTGSSNFSQSGFQDNLEFNVELKNRSDYEFALNNFNRLWEKAVDVSHDYVTTEVLAEGVNLHRANTVINYDIPWNPTRLMQRVGRVNRINTTFPAIYTYNFFPTEFFVYQQ